MGEKDKRAAVLDTVYHRGERPWIDRQKNDGENLSEQLLQVM